MDRLAAETAYGAPGTGVGGDGAIRWRKTYVPGPSGLDDAPQLVVEVYQPGPYSGTASTYTYVTDEMGTTLAVVAEDEGGTATQPPVPVRYLYTPYGQAHPEIGPELLRVRFDATATSMDSGTGGAVTQVVPDTTEAAPGALVLTWSSPIAESSLPTGLHVERLAAGEGWVPVPADEIAVGITSSSDPLTDTSTELRVLRIWGWQEATSYRVRLTPELADRLGRPFGRSETLQWSVPAAPSEEDDVPPPQYEQRYPRRYESYEAAGATAGGRFPGGQSRLFQGLWTDPVTGISYARARWLDSRTANWLSEDPLGAVDSQNRYAFVAWQPTMATDPLGLCLGISDLPCWETAKSLGGFVVGTVESAGNLAVGLVTAPVAIPYRQAKRGFSEAGRIYYAYQEGGFEAALAEDRAIRGERVDDAVETLISLVPGINTYRQGAQIARIYEQEGSFAGGRQVGRTTFSLATDATVVYGATRVAQAGSAASTTTPRINLVGQRSLQATTAAQEAAAARAAAAALRGTGAESAANALRLRNQLAAREIGSGHAFEKHVIQRGEFPGVSTQGQFSEVIEGVLNRPTHVRELARSRTAFFDEGSGVLVIRNPAAPDGGTAFVPTNGLDYFRGLQ